MPYTWGADKSLARLGRKQARKHVRDARDFNNIETRAIIKVFFFSARRGAEGNSRHSDRNISFFSFLVGLRTYQHACSRRGEIYHSKFVLIQCNSKKNFVDSHLQMFYVCVCLEELSYIKCSNVSLAYDCIVKTCKCFFFLPVPPHVLCGLRGPPSWAWQKCNGLLRLGRP